MLEFVSVLFLGNSEKLVDKHARNSQSQAWPEAQQVDFPKLILPPIELSSSHTPNVVPATSNAFRITLLSLNNIKTDIFDGLFSELIQNF